MNGSLISLSTNLFLKLWVGLVGDAVETDRESFVDAAEQAKEEKRRFSNFHTRLEIGSHCVTD